MVSEGKVADADLLEDDNKSGPGESPSDDCQMIPQPGFIPTGLEKNDIVLRPGQLSSVS
jgi:hypothetical protein